MSVESARGRAFVKHRVAFGARVVLVAAADEAWGIGASGGLPWRCPEDLRHFRRRTAGGVLVMGRRTFEGLPVTLDGRTVHVVSREAAWPLSDVEALIARLLIRADEVIVAGGAAVYEAALPLCSSAEVTRIRGRYQCDARMPDLAGHGWTMKRNEILSPEATIEYWERPN